MNSSAIKGAQRVMKRFSMLAALGVMAIGLAAPLAHADGNFSNYKAQYDTFTVNTCTNDIVTVSGTFHYVDNQTDANTYVFNINGHLTGTGSNGNSYVWNFQESAKSTSSPFSFDTRTHDVLVSQGSAPNQLMTIHVTYPPLNVSIQTVCTS